MMRTTFFLTGVLLMITRAADADEQRWLAPGGALATTGELTMYALPEDARGPTTVALAPDGAAWFTLGSDAIGRMDPDGSNVELYSLPSANSAPRIIALGADGNMWFSEHIGNRIGRITPQGDIAEFAIPTASSQPRAIALGADGNIWFGMFAAGKIGRI